MECKNCNTPLNEGVKFCAKCGTPVPDISVAVSPEAPVIPSTPETYAAPTVSVAQTYATPNTLTTPKTPFFKKWWPWAILSLILAIALAVTSIFAFAPSSKKSKDDDDDDDKPRTTSSEAMSDESDSGIEITDSTHPATPPVSSMTPAELESALMTLPVVITETIYHPADAQYPTLYPAILSAVLLNNSGEDIKSCTVAFVAWDSNNLPIKIISEYDFSGGSYIKECNYDAINLVNGDTFGNNYGLALGEDCDNIYTFKAIVVDYEDFDGNTWENPYYEIWKNTYAEKRLG